jgi:serine/threonine protein kinase
LGIIIKYASPEAVELIDALLLYNPKHRVSCDEALRHRFFTDHLDENQMFSKLGTIRNSLVNSPLKSVKTRQQNNL